MAYERWYKKKIIIYVDIINDILYKSCNSSIGVNNLKWLVKHQLTRFHGSFIITVN